MAAKLRRYLWLRRRGVVHFSLPVTDLDRSARFYSELLGMKIVQQTPRMVFLKCGDDYFILAKDTPVKYDSLEQTPVHHAFKVATEEFEPAVEFLKQKGVEIFHVEDRRDGVFWGRQAYFLDPDGNKLEIHDPQGMGV